MPSKDGQVSHASLHPEQVESLWNQARLAGMSRRNFLLLLGCGGAAAVMMTLASCVPKATPTPTTTLPTSPTTPTTSTPTTPAQLIYEPIPPELTPAEQHHILGVQGNLWTEYIPTPELAGYMLFPRASALAEVAWSKPEQRNYADFQYRLDKLLPALTKLGLNFRQPKGVQ